MAFHHDPGDPGPRSRYGLKQNLRMTTAVMTVGQLAHATSCNVETIRYYENIGLMPAPPRTPNGYRSYDERHISRPGFIRRARDLGFTLDDVRALLSLAEPESPACAQVKDIAAQHLMQVRKKIAELGRLEHILSATIARCTSDPATPCPVLDMLEA